MDSYTGSATAYNPNNIHPKHTEYAMPELRDHHIRGINNPTGSNPNSSNSVILTTNTELSDYQPYRTRYNDPVGLPHMAPHIIGVSDAEEPNNNIIGHETASLSNDQLSLSMLPRIHIAPGVLLP